MRLQKIEFWHRGKALILENRGKGKPAVGIEFSDKPDKFAKEKPFVLHKKMSATAVRNKAEQLAELLCGDNADDPEKELIIRDVFEVLWRMAAWR